MKIQSLISLFLSTLLFFTQMPLSADAHMNNNQQRCIFIEMNVPDTTWGLKIEAVYQVGEELWTLSELKRAPSGMIGLTMITQLKDKVSVNASAEAPVKHFVLGKTWGWENEEDITFIESLDELKDHLENAERLYPTAAHEHTDP